MIILQIIHLIAKHLNWTIEVALTGEMDVFKNNIDLMRNGTIDLFALTFEKTSRREKEYDFSLPLYDVSAILKFK